MKKRILSLILASLMILSVIPVFTASAFTLGDVDGDGFIKAADARLALRASVGLEKLSDEAIAAADADRDGQIKAADARLILRASVGLEQLHTHEYTKETVTKKATCTEKGEKKLSCECGDFITEEIAVIAHKEVKDKAVAATCTETGKTEGSHCSVCGKVLKAQETVKAKGHTAVTDKAVAATCTETGKTEGSHCSVCGEVLKAQETVKAKGHTAVTDKAVAATCTETGKTEGSHCSVCGEVLKAQEAVKATGHSKVLDETTVKEKTCKEDGYSGDYKCSVCGIVLEKGIAIPSEGTEHKLSTLNVEASCIQEGYSVTACEYCDYYDESTYKTGAPAKGHSWSEETTVSPTCTEQGYNIKTCSVCEASEKSDYTDPKGHNYQNWNVTKTATCKEAGARTGTCKVCGEKTTELIPITPCTPDTKVTRVEGSKENNIPCKEVVKCKVCGDVLSESETMAAHRTQVVSQTKETCTTARIVKEECKYCNYTYTNNNAADPLGHETTLVSTTPATCTVDGSRVYSGHCSRCKQTFDNTVVVIKAKGHSPSGIQTCTTNVSCITCGEVLEEKLGHDYNMHSKAYGKEIETFFCARCGAARNANENLNVFNNTANNIKSYTFCNEYAEQPNLRYVDKSSATTTYSRFDFGIYTPAIKEMYEDEMANIPDDYSPVRPGGIRTMLPLLANYTTVSELTSSDIDSIKVERLSGLNISDVLSAYATTYTIGSKTYDLSAYKNTKISGDVIKVTIDVKNEKLSVVKNLGKNEKTSLSKIYDIDIREQADEFRNEKGELVKSEIEKGDGYEISMIMRLEEIKSDAVVTYYLDADTYEPIIALYNTDVTMEQTIDMSFKIGLFSLNGAMDPIVTTKYTRAYLFPNYFPQ